VQSTTSIRSSPAIINNILYVGAGGGSYSENKTYAINTTDGKHIWNFTANEKYEASPTSIDGIVYIGADDNNFYALNASTGAQIWNYSTGNDIRSSSVVTTNMIFIASKDNRIYSLNTTTGTHLWNYTAGNQILSSPSIANGIVYIGSDDGYLYAFGQDLGAPVISYVVPTDNNSQTVARNWSFVNVTVADQYSYNNISVCLLEWTNSTGSVNITMTASAVGPSIYCYYNQGICK